MIPGITAHMIPAAGGGGPITYVGGDQGWQEGTSDITLTLPTHQADDFGIILVNADWSVTISSISGWTSLQNWSDDVDEKQQAEVFYRKFTSSSETNPVVSIGGVNDKLGALVTVFRGVDTTTPFDATEAIDAWTGTYDGPFPTITTTETTSAFVGFALVRDTRATNVTNGSTSPGTLIKTLEGYGTSWDDFQHAVFYDLDIGSSGSITYNADCAWTKSGAGKKAAYISLALKMA